VAVVFCAPLVRLDEFRDYRPRLFAPTGNDADHAFEREHGVSAAALYL
jgi:hypothetical protein